MRPWKRLLGISIPLRKVKESNSHRFNDGTVFKTAYSPLSATFQIYTTAEDVGTDPT